MDGPFPIELRQRENLENKGPQEVSGCAIRKAEVGKRVDRTEVQFRERLRRGVKCERGALLDLFEGFRGQRISQGNAEGSKSEGWGNRRHCKRCRKKENNNYATVLKKLI